MLDDIILHEDEITGDVVECINPEVRKGRLYRLTGKGEEVTKNINLD